ncbi:hypothetical protein ASB1_07960 [Helicobacter heilmannii]|nr:hypothetical protein ASB1_07960 [Helicobacter heilmannii]
MPAVLAHLKHIALDLLAPLVSVGLFDILFVLAVATHFKDLALRVFGLLLIVVFDLGLFGVAVNAAVHLGAVWTRIMPLVEHMLAFTQVFITIGAGF